MCLDQIGNMAVYNSIFSNNSMSVRGGVIYASSSDYTWNSSV